MAWFDRERFCLQIQRHQFLYNTTHPDHNNRVRSEMTYAVLAENFGLKDASEAKSKFKSLKDSYRTQKKKLMNIKSGSRANMNKIWPLYEACSFLDPYIGESGRKSSNFTIQTKIKNENQDSAGQLLSSLENGESEDVPNDDPDIESLAELESEPELSVLSEQMPRGYNTPYRKPTRVRKQLSSDLEDTLRGNNQEFSASLKTVIEKKPAEDTEIDIYCQYLAKRLKTYKTSTVRFLQNKIDNLLYECEMCETVENENN